MTQFDFGTIDPSTKSGTVLASDLNSWRNAIHSMHAGNARPAYATGGMQWVDISAAPIWTVKLYDGTDDISLYQIDTSNNVIRIAGKRQEVIKTADYTLTADDAFVAIVNNKGSAAVLNLPALSGTNNELYFVRNIAAFDFVIDPNSTEQIEGATTLTLKQGDAAWIWIASGKGSWRASVTRQKTVTLDGTETLTNKTLTTPTLTLKQSSNPTPTTEGAIEWDTDDDVIVVGNGSGQTVVRTIKLGTPQATTNGTVKDFTVPSNAKRIIISFDSVSTNGVTPFLVQIGDSGGIETTGYVSSGTAVISPTGGTYSTGFAIGVGLTAARFYYGQATLVLMNASTNKWSFTGQLARDSDGQTILGSGIKSLSDVITTVRVTTSGADTFDLGEINIAFE